MGGDLDYGSNLQCIMQRACCTLKAEPRVLPGAGLKESGTVNAYTVASMV